MGAGVDRDGESRMSTTQRNNTLNPVWAVAALLVAFVVTDAPTRAQAQSHKPHKVVKYDFPFYNSYEAGLAAARASGKPILLDFYFDT